MTQQPAPAPPDRGAVRAAVEGLLRACVDLERNVDGVSTGSSKRVRGVAHAVATMQLPTNVLDVPALVQEVDGLGRRLDADVTSRLAEARHPLVTEIHALLALLAPVHGLAALPPLVPVGPGATLTDHFPTGFAHDYVDDLIAGIPAGVRLEPAGAARVAAQSSEDTNAALMAVRQAFDAPFTDDGMALLTGHGCHVVQRHGPHISDQAQLARLLCLKDPSGGDIWQVLPSAAIYSEHRCGPVSGGFTSPRALVRPLEAVFTAASSRPGGIQELLNDNTKAKAKVITLHVSSAIAGLTPGDASGYRGTGTATRAMREDWSAAREYGLTHGRAMVYGVPYDPLAAGVDPGVLMVFRRTKAGEPWRLVTYFPVDEQRPDSKRLENLT